MRHRAPEPIQPPDGQHVAGDAGIAQDFRRPGEARQLGGRRAARSGSRCRTVRRAALGERLHARVSAKRRLMGGKPVFLDTADQAQPGFQLGIDRRRGRRRIRGRRLAALDRGHNWRVGRWRGRRGRDRRFRPDRRGRRSRDVARINGRRCHAALRRLPLEKRVGDRQHGQDDERADNEQRNAVQPPHALASLRRRGEVVRRGVGIANSRFDFVAHWLTPAVCCPAWRTVKGAASTNEPSVLRG